MVYNNTGLQAHSSISNCSLVTTLAFLLARYPYNITFKPNNVHGKAEKLSRLSLNDAVAVGNLPDVETYQMLLILILHK